MKPSKKPSINIQSSAPRKDAEETFPSNVGVRYLYQPDELEGGERKRATDPVWSLDIYRIERSVINPGQPIVYYLNGIKRGSVQQELLVLPQNTELPPDKLI